MTYTRHNLSTVIGKKTLNITDRKALVNEIAAYLLEENLTADLDSIMRDVMQYRLENGIVEAVVVSAHELSAVDMKDIEELLKAEYPTAKSYVIDQRYDPDVIGGVKIDLPGAQLDLTVFEKLSVFKRHAVAGKETR